MTWDAEEAPGTIANETGQTSSAAKQLGKAQSTIYKWLKRGAPKEDDGRVNVDALREWRAAEQRAKQRSGTDTTAMDTARPPHTVDSEVQKWALEYRRAKALLALIDVQKARDEVIDVTEHKQIVVARALIYRQKLEQLPKRVAHELHGLSSPVEIQARLEREVRTILQAVLSTSVEPTPVNEDDEDEESEREAG